MIERLDSFDGYLRECNLTFVCVSDKGAETRNVSGRLEASSNVELFGYRFRFKEGERDANIGMIFPEERSSQCGEGNSNRIYLEDGKLVLEYAVKKCPGINGCCQPWNNYLRYFAEPEKQEVKAE